MEEGLSPKESAIAACGELSIPLLVSSLTTSAAFLAFFLAENTMGEMLRLVDVDEPGDQLEEEGLLSYLEMHIPEENAKVVQEKLKDILAYLEELADADHSDEELRKFRLTMALYPLDKFK